MAIAVYVMKCPERVCHHENGRDMNDPQRDTQPGDSHLRRALEQAHQLSEPRPTNARHTPDWYAKAAHVGDISVLALALRN
jgi:hypothetical protein